MKLKMVITDLDGTLLDSSELVSQQNIEAFNWIKKKGVLPVVATGRVKDEAWYALQAIGATDYFIAMNGAMISDYQLQHTISEVYLSKDTALRIVEILIASGLFFQIYSRECVACTPAVFVKRYQSRLKLAYLDRFGEQILVAEDINTYLACINKFLVVIEDSQQQQSLKQLLAGIKDITIVASSMHYFEIIPTSVNKGVAVRKLCDYLNISLSEVMAIGDSHNDLEMLSIVGVAVAMGNAVDEVKEIAHHVVSSNNEHGVAEALQLVDW